MQSLRTALAICGMVIAAPATVLAQASSTIERYVEQIDDQIENPCTGELVHVTGTVKTTMRRTVDANGVVHLVFTSIPSIRGEGASGEYNVLGNHGLRDKFIDNAYFPENVSFTDAFHLVSKGKGVNFLFTLNVHWVVDSDGTTKVDFGHEVGKCTG